MTVLAHALAWHLRGYVPLPLRTDGSKAPAVRSWKPFIDSPPDIQATVELFKIDTDGLGLLTGTPSGGLELFELEGRAVTEGYLDRLAVAFHSDGHGDLWKRITQGYVERTPSGGVHHYYRVTGGDPLGNTRLASRPATPEELAEHQAQARQRLATITDPQAREKQAERIDRMQPTSLPQVLIETRGQGGFVVIAPSGGRSHKTGADWEVVTGSMDTIPTLTAVERDIAHRIARSLDQMPQPVVNPDRLPTPTPTAPTGVFSLGGPTTSPGALRPGDDFAARTSWAEILGPHGWQVHHHEGRTTHWTRPGKALADGASATTGHSDSGDRLFVFSTSTEFEAEKPYDKLGAHALLNHGGDLEAAVRALGEAGYGSSRDPLDGLTEGATPTTPVATVTPGRHLHAVPDSPVAATDGTAALAVAADTQPAASVTSIELARYGQTEDGVSRALVDRLQHALRYCPQRSSWLVWDGTRWAWDEAGVHREHLKAIARQLPDNDVWKQHRKRMLSARGVEGAAKLASTDPRIVVNAHDLDANPWILNTPSGVVDLHTGELRPASPDDLCTRMTAAAYDPEARAPRWEAFLEETFGGDAELIAYLQRLAGYSAAGVVTHHILPFAFGPGGAGKTVFLETVPGVLGEYASTAPAGFLMAGRHDESAIAGLQGARMVVCSEVNERDRFDEAKVKLLTGGDRLRSRFLYGNYFTFTPTHTLWLMGNYQPRVEAGGSSFWRRLRVLPFAHAVPPEKRIEGFADMLRSEEGQGILAWIIQGATHVLNNKLVEPERVKAATDTYAEEEDHLSRFMEERVMLTSTAREKASDIRSAYTSWCSAEGITASSNQILVRELRTRWGIQATKSNGTRYYAGLTLLSDEVEADDGDPRATHWNLR